MATRLTTKGQVTIPKAIRDHLGIKAGDAVEFGIGRASTVELRPAGPDAAYRDALSDVRRRRPVTGVATDAYMSLVRDEP